MGYSMSGNFQSCINGVLMEWMGIEEFAAWAEKKGLILRPNPAEVAWIELPGGKSRFWLAPPNALRLSALFEDLLAGLEAWGTCVLWPTNSGWPSLHDGFKANDRVYNTILRLARINGPCEGSAVFSADERDILLAILVAHMSIKQGFVDLFVVPDHGRQILHASHHDVVHVTCPNALSMNNFVQHMKAHHHELPEAPPDGTFKSVEWTERK